MQIPANITRSVNQAMVEEYPSGIPVASTSLVINREPLCNTKRGLRLCPKLAMELGELFFILGLIFGFIYSLLSCSLLYQTTSNFPNYAG